MRVSPLLAGAALTLALAACGQSNSLEYSRQQLELQQQRAAAERAEQRADALEPVSRVASFTWYALLAVVPVLAVGVALDTYLQRRKALVYPNHAGQLPVPRAMIDSGELAGAMVEALGAYHRTQQIAASQPRIDKLNITVKEPSPLPQIPLTAPGLITAQPEAPVLPSIVELADVLPTVRGGHLAFGMLPNGELLQLPFGRAYHFLGAGDTRTGKTVMLDSLIVQLHHMAQRLPLSLYGGDFKRELAATWSNSPLFAAIETQPGAIADMLVDLVEGPDGVHRRYDLFKQAGQERGRIIRNIGEWKTITGELPRLSIVVLDEINAVLEAAKRSDRVAESLKVLLQTGAGAGVYVLGGAQYLSTAVFSRDGSKQFVSRCLFGAYDDTSARMMFGGNVDTSIRAQIDGTPGRGLIRTVSQAQPQPFQALHAGEQDILAAIATISADGKAQPTYAVSPSTAQESPKALIVGSAEILPETPETTAHSTMETPTVEVPEIEKVQMIALAQAGISRTKICQQLYGVSAGRAYERVKQTLNAAGL